MLIAESENRSSARNGRQSSTIDKAPMTMGLIAASLGIRRARGSAQSDVPGDGSRVEFRDMATQPKRTVEYDVIEPIGERVVVRKDDNKRESDQR